MPRLLPGIAAVIEHGYCGKGGDVAVEDGKCARRRRGTYGDKCRKQWLSLLILIGPCSRL